MIGVPVKAIKESTDLESFFTAFVLLALLFFVWGGILFLTSAGSQGRITQAKSILTNTILGVVIVFIAWTGVNFIIDEIAGTPKVLFNRTQAWYNLCAGTGTNQCLGKGDGFPCNGRNGHCENGQCIKGVEACEWLNDHAGYTEYKCQHYEMCGLTSYNECDTASNCIKNLCAEGIERVCCYPKK